jgi:threonine synthase
LTATGETTPTFVIEHMSIWKWASMLPSPAEEHRITLGEGATPLVPSRAIGPRAGLRGLQFKLEASNPSGSFKDRFAAAAVGHMLAAGQTRCIATSSGNTGSALAAYCAVAGIACKIAIVETAPTGKLLQMLAYGAELYRVRGFGLDPLVTAQTFETLVQLGEKPNTALRISAYKYSPLGMSGVETISLEIAAQLGRIDHVFVPAGGGGLTLAVARGFEGLKERGSRSLPRVHCVQPVGNDTIAGPLRAGHAVAVDVRCQSTISGLQVPNVLDGHDVIAACRKTGGLGYSVEDAAVYELQRRLAREEGIFCEPAGAVALAGAMDARQRVEVGADDSIVCLVTGSGFKDMAAVEKMTSSAGCRMIGLDQLAESFAD